MNSELMKRAEFNNSDSTAIELVKDTIKQFKDNGTETIDIIDIHAKTKLPFQQIGEIMDELEKEGMITSS